MAFFGCSFLPSSDHNNLPSPMNQRKHERLKSIGLLIGRTRARWVLIALAIITIICICGFRSVYTPDVDQYRLYIAEHTLGIKNNTLWCSLVNNKTEVDNQTVTSSNQWLNGSGRVDLSYNSPFNPDDLTMTNDECDAFFLDLYKEIDRSIDYFTNREEWTEEYLEYSCDDGIWTHARVIIHNNRVYLKYYQQSDFTRSQAALALLHQAVSTSREKLPNVEFCIGMMDWGSRGKFSLDRSPDREDVWLMPDYGWWTWPEHVGSYQELREKAAKVEAEIGWEGKTNKLFWRGSLKVGRADRKALMRAAKGHEWNDVLGIDWACECEVCRQREAVSQSFPAPDTPAVAMEDHCRWKFQGFPEGNTYSGRLRYLQNCRVVIVTHEPRWLQHWTHLYNADWNSPDQNIVYVPKGNEEPSGMIRNVVHDKRRFGPDRTWERLPETMNRLLKDDELAKKIADNQWSYFRERYITPASATCYWRKAIHGLSRVQKFSVCPSGEETSYESFVLKGMKQSTTQ